MNRLMIGRVTFIVGVLLGVFWVVGEIEKTIQPPFLLTVGFLAVILIVVGGREADGIWRRRESQGKLKEEYEKKRKLCRVC